MVTAVACWWLVLFQFDVDEFVACHLNDHRKGVLGRQLSTEALLTFSKACHSTSLVSADVTCLDAQVSCLYG